MLHIQYISKVILSFQRNKACCLKMAHDSNTRGKDLVIQIIAGRIMELATKCFLWSFKSSIHQQLTLHYYPWAHPLVPIYEEWQRRAKFLLNQPTVGKSNSIELTKVRFFLYQIGLCTRTKHTREDIPTKIPSCK